MSLPENTLCNIPQKIWDLRPQKLHNQPNHPLEIIKRHIYKYFGDKYPKYDNLSEVVTIQNNFDRLLIPPEHPCRSRSDTYYLDETTLLRTQTTSHQIDLLEKMLDEPDETLDTYEMDNLLVDNKCFLVTGDVYRKDEIDRSHYPVFHQMEGLCIVNKEQDPAEELHKVLSGLVEYLFPGCQYRVNKDYFPFTNPSWEYEVKYKDGSDDDEKNWLEILGCGVTQQQILDDTGHGHNGKKAWAFGLGLERLAMHFFDIPDIRMFWSTDEKFLSQFSDGKIRKFQPYSTLDPVQHDISMWIKDEDIEKNEEDLAKSTWKRQNDFYDFIRSNDAFNMIELIECFDTFYHPKKNMLSHAYHIKYSPPDTKINNPAEMSKICNELHQSFYPIIDKELNVIHR
jgi:phenylalanyl-tRNA synthetase alpha chain